MNHILFFIKQVRHQLFKIDNKNIIKISIASWYLGNIFYDFYLIFRKAKG